MTEHPITPPPELVGEWLCDGGYLWDPSGDVTITITTNRLRNVATQAARWGADQELEACCEWFVYTHPDDRNLGALRAARRPKPPSKKQRALKALSQIEDQFLSAELAAEIRCALEELPDD